MVLAVFLFHHPKFPSPSATISALGGLPGDGIQSPIPRSLSPGDYPLLSLGLTPMPLPDHTQAQGYREAPEQVAWAPCLPLPAPVCASSPASPADRGQLPL